MKQIEESLALLKIFALTNKSVEQGKVPHFVKASRAFAAAVRSVADCDCAG